MMTKLGRWRRRPDESGQVEVETAVVMPMVVFLLLGLMQMGLLNQARMVAKYAAYRAVRWGITHNLGDSGDSADSPGGMEKAALAAALPVLSYNIGSGDTLGRTDSADKWSEKFLILQTNRLLPTTCKYTEVTICGPTSGDVNPYKYGDDLIAFDNPAMGAKPRAGKVRIQLIVNYPMFVPFANWIIFRMWRGTEIPKHLHVGDTTNSKPDAPGACDVDAAALMKVYIIPLVVEYSMRLQSDARVAMFPDDNNCLQH